MDELIELKKQVSIHGIEQFIPLLVKNDTALVDNSLEEGSDDDTSDSEVEEDSSEDDVSSIDGDGHASDDTESDNELIGEYIGGFWNNNDVIHIHDPPIFASRHCPPLGSVEDTMHGICDCTDFGMNVCAKEDEFQFFSTIDLLYEMKQPIP